MQKRVKTVIACIFLAIAILYPTYAIIEGTTEDLKWISSMFGFEHYPETQGFVETMSFRHQISMYMLLAIQVVCIAVFTALMLTKENG